MKINLSRNSWICRFVYVFLRNENPPAEEKLLKFLSYLILDGLIFLSTRIFIGLSYFSLFLFGVRPAHKNDPPVAVVPYRYWPRIFGYRLLPIFFLPILLPLLIAWLLCIIRRNLAEIVSYLIIPAALFSLLVFVFMLVCFICKKIRIFSLINNHFQLRFY